MLTTLALPFMLAGAARPAALPVQDQPQEAARAFVRTLAGEDGELSLEEVRRGLAEIELLVVVEREFQGADHRLEALRQRIEETCRTRPESADLREACVLGLLAHVELQLARGRVEDARAELPEPAVADSPVSPMGFLAEDPRVVQMAAFVDRRLGRGGEDGPAPEAALIGLEVQDETMSQVLADAIEHGDSQFILEMGGSAISFLVQAVEEELNVFPRQWTYDALDLLTRIHPPTAVQLMLRHRDERGLFWRKRVLRALEDAGVTGSNDSWDLVAGKAPFACRIPALLVVLEEMVADPVVGTDALALLGPVLDHGGLTPGLQAALAEALDAEDGARRGAAAQLVTASPASENLRSVLEAALTSRRRAVRILAAQRLTNLPWSDGLSRRVDDPEPGVRRAIVTLLERRNLGEFNCIPQTKGIWTGWQETKHVPTYGAPQRATLARLLRDPAPEIRRSALEVISLFPTREEPRSGWAGDSKMVRRIAEPPAAEVLLSMSEDPSPAVRQYLADLAGSLPTDLATGLLLALADDVLPDVLEQVDHSLAALPLEDRPVRAVEVLRVRAGGSLGFDPRSRGYPTLWDRLKRTREGRELLAAWALEPGASHLLSLLVRTPDESFDERILDLSPAIYARLVAALEGVDDPMQEKLLSSADDAGLQAALLEVARDAGLPPSLRLKCAAVSARIGGPTFVSRMIDVLRDPGWTGGQSVDRASLGHFRRAPGADRNAVLLGLLGDATTSDALIGNLAEEFAPTSPGGPEVARAILERWYEQPGNWGGGPVWHVFSAMASSDEIRDDALIASAARHEVWWEPAIGAIESLRDPALLPILEDILRGEKGSNRWGAAAHAVAAFMTDDAAELLLLAAAGAGDSQNRAYYMAKLQTLHEYFQARDYWQRRRALERSREGAVVELYELLEDPREPLRVQAIRALATFEAVEAIPILIRLLADPSPAIAVAAEEALERLNRVEPGQPSDEPPGKKGDADD